MIGRAFYCDKKEQNGHFSGFLTTFCKPVGAGNVTYLMFFIKHAKLFFMSSFCCVVDLMRILLTPSFKSDVYCKVVLVLVC